MAARDPRCARGAEGKRGRNNPPTRGPSASRTARAEWKENPRSTGRSLCPWRLRLWRGKAEATTRREAPLEPAASLTIRAEGTADATGARRYFAEIAPAVSNSAPPWSMPVAAVALGGQIRKAHCVDGNRWREGFSARSRCRRLRSSCVHSRVTLQRSAAGARSRLLHASDRPPSRLGAPRSLPDRQHARAPATEPREIGRA